MQEYWDMISSEHQEKLKALAEKKGVDLDAAMGNIVNYLKSDDIDLPDYFKDVILAKQIEEMIDQITR